MTIDDMEKGREYTIHYRNPTTGEMTAFEGCRFESIAVWTYPELEDAEEVRFVVAYTADSAPTAALFADSRIEGIEPE